MTLYLRKFIYFQLVIGFLILLPVKCFTQDNTNWQINPKYHYGTILPHHESVMYLMKDSYQNIELCFSKHLDSSKLVSKAYNNPATGYGIQYADFGNNDVFGKAVSLYCFFNFPLTRQKYFDINMQFTEGLAYFNNDYDYHENYTNIVIGSKLNIYINISFEASIHLTKRIDINAGTGFHHYSNGKMKLPNLGINVLSFYMGARYNFSERGKELRRNAFIPDFKKHNELLVRYSFGSKSVKANHDKNYFTNTLSVNYNRVCNYKYKIGIGGDISYDNSTNTAMNLKKERNATKTEYYKTGIHLSNTLVIGNLSVYLDIGIYVGYLEHINEYPIYDRVGLNYFINDKLFLNTAIKAHYAKADYIDLGIGYKIK